MATGVGARIKQARLKLGLTQEELGKRMGKTKYLISKVENGLDNLTLDKVSEYAKVLNVSPSYLMGWDEDPDYLIDGTILVERKHEHSDRLAEISKLLNQLSDKDLNMVVQYAEFLSKRKEE